MKKISFILFLVGSFSISHAIRMRTNKTVFDLKNLGKGCSPLLTSYSSRCLKNITNLYFTGNYNSLFKKKGIVVICPSIPAAVKALQQKSKKNRLTPKERTALRELESATKQ